MDPKGKQSEDQQQVTLEQVKSNKGVHILSVIPYGSEARIPVKKLDNQSYIPVQLLADVLEYRTLWDEDSMSMKLGVNGPEFELQADSAKALKADKPVSLSKPLVMDQDSLYIPVESLGDLFGSDMSFRVNDTEVTINPTSTDTVKIKGVEEPTAEPPAPQEDIHFWEKAALSPEQPTAARVHNHYIAAGADGGRLDFDQMEATAKRYLGIKYQFGTGPFAQTGFFDCSSFMQFLFAKQNVDLPRTARAQSELGVNVSRSQLQKGDMLFFYVPGRFRTDEVVGHVGLYIGNGMMIHSSPKPQDGVQLTDINQPYWKNTYMKAARISAS
jgi:cell wall-associated NlpC family hydrolase